MSGAAGDALRARSPPRRRARSRGARRPSPPVSSCLRPSRGACQAHSTIPATPGARRAGGGAAGRPRRRRGSAATPCPRPMTVGSTSLKPYGANRRLSITNEVSAPAVRWNRRARLDGACRQLLSRIPARVPSFQRVEAVCVPVERTWHRICYSKRRGSRPDGGARRCRGVEQGPSRNSRRLGEGPENEH